MRLCPRQGVVLLRDDSGIARLVQFFLVHREGVTIGKHGNVQVQVIPPAKAV